MADVIKNVSYDIYMNYMYVDHDARKILLDPIPQKNKLTLFLYYQQKHVKLMELDSQGS